jgi:hypothetical protein
VEARCARYYLIRSQLTFGVMPPPLSRHFKPMGSGGLSMPLIRASYQILLRALSGADAPDEK